MSGGAAVKPRFVFVAGLHRTGTSLLADMLAQHPQISAITGAPVPEQEGCYLQGAIPHTAQSGVPGQFATDPAQHYTEAHTLNSMETRDRLWSDWRDWFDLAKPWLLEKSPVNLTRMRLLQALFPTAKFVVVLRHPQIMAAALAKWSDRDGSELIRYGVEAYDIMAADHAFLHSCFVLRYEDLIRRPDDWVAALHGFLGLDPNAVEHDIWNGNCDYRDLPPIPADCEDRMARWGYEEQGGIGTFAPEIRDPLRYIRETTAGRVARISWEHRSTTSDSKEKTLPD